MRRIWLETVFGEEEEKEEEEEEKEEKEGDEVESQRGTEQLEPKCSTWQLDVEHEFHKGRK